VDGSGAAFSAFYEFGAKAGGKAGLLRELPVKCFTPFGFM